MRETRKLEVDTGYLYLNGFCAVDTGVRDKDMKPVLNGYQVDFGNAFSQISFPISEDMVDEIVGCDAITVEISIVKSDGAE